MPNITICKNPFRPHLERVETAARAGTRLDTVLRREGLITGRGRALTRNHTFVVQLNGDWLTQDKWARRLSADDVVLVAMLPAGGGGSNPLQIVAMVALVAVAIAAPYALGLTSTVGLVGGGTLTTVTALGSMVSAGIMIGGGLLLSAIFPPAKPPSTMAREQASPTYTIGAQGNMARLMESIPVQYGRFRVYPDFAAQPYTELDSNQTYLYQLFCLGQGEYDIEEIRIEDTPIGNFAEVQYEVVRPGEKVTLFPDNVVTSTAVQGIELKGPNEDGFARVGPFVVNPSGTTTNKIAVDMVFPAGLFYANDDGDLDSRSATWEILAQQIDDQGNLIGAPLPLGNETYSAATNTPQMMTYRYDVPEGRYQVSAMRTSNKETSNRSGNMLQWGGMRAYLPDHRDYGDLTLVAVVIRATNNLNQSIARRINVIGTRKLRTWDPIGGWSFGVTATRNPAWALADVCKNPQYGRGLPDSRINLTALYRLSRIWDDRGDTYDGVFDTATTLWDGLTRIARVGRAMPMYYAGVIDFIRNEPKTVKTQMFTPGNMVTNTFSVDYVFPQHDSPDHVIVEFINEQTWQPDEVVCALPGSAMQQPYRLQIPGIVQRDQAWREGISLAAQNRDQRRFVSFQTELEGNIPRYGDLVEISHDVPKWGLTGFIEDYDPETRTLTTSEQLEWWPGENHYINLRKKDGSPDGPYRVVAGSHDRQMVIADRIDGYAVFVSDGQGEEFTYYQFGPGERRSLLAQALSATPDEQGHVALDFVNYAESVHAAENGGVVPPPNPSSLLPTTPNAPVVNEVTVYATPVAGEQIAACTPARGAHVYEFQASDDLGASWTSLGSDTTPSIRIRLPVGPWWVRARGVGAMPGPWKRWQGHITATMLPPPALSFLTTAPLNWGIRISWAWPPAISLRYIEIWHSRTSSFLDATLLGLFAYPQSSHDMMGLALTGEFYFWARVRDEADQPGPWYPASGPGVRGVPNQSASDYNELITKEIVEGGLGDILMGNIRDIPSIKDAVGDLTLELGELNQRVDEVNGQVQELLNANEWEAAATYAKGVVVFFDGKMYRAKKAVPAGKPVSDATYWELIGDYASITDGLAALAIQSQETISRVERAEDQIQVNAEQISTVAGKVNDPKSGLDALGSAVQSMRTQVGQLQDGLQSLSEATLALSSEVEGLDLAQQGLANAVSQLSTRVQATEDKLESQASNITQLEVELGALTAPAGNLLLDSNVELVRDPGIYLFGRYYLAENFVANEDYTLVVNYTHKSAPGDATSHIAVWAAGGSNKVGELEKDKLRHTQVLKFKKNSSLAVPKELRFYFGPNPGTVAGEGVVHWATLYKGTVLPTKEWQPSLGGLQAKAQANASAIDGLSTEVTQHGNTLTSQGRDLSALQNTVNDPQTGVAATAGALNDTNTRVTDVAGKQEALASNQLILNAEIKRQQAGEDAYLENVLNQFEAQREQFQIKASLAEFKNVQADENRALAELITTLEAGINEDSAAVEQVMRALVELDGRLEASWGVNVEVNQNGVRYTSGFALGVSNESGVVQSTFAVLADRFAVMHARNGDPVTVFSVQGGASILNTALIGSASITEAKIADAAITSVKIADAAISSAKIADAAITKAKIGVAEVDTLRLAGNAVTMHASRSGSGAIMIDTVSGGVATVTVFYPGEVNRYIGYKVLVSVNGSWQATLTSEAGTIDPQGLSVRIQYPITRSVTVELRAGMNVIDASLFRDNVLMDGPIDTVVLFAMR